jgi:3',5'-cyclic AMP phosphodiesterase CpdA
MSVLLHISDTHFGTEQPPVVEALLALAAQQRPALVVLSGDITQRARPAEFQAAKRFLDRLGAPVLAVPGNHDLALPGLWSRLTQPYGRFAKAFGPEVEPVVDSPHWLVVGVNTTRVWRHRHGEVSAAQVARVAQWLAAASPQQLRAVLVHQPLAVADARERVHRLRGHAHAAREWARAGADVVLGGHIHLPYVLPLHGLTRRMWVVQAGTAVSSRTRRGVPHSVNVLRWGHGDAVGALSTGDSAAECRVEQWDFLAEQQAFVRVAVSVLQPERGNESG